MSGWQALHLDEIPTIAFESAEEPDWKPLRHRLGVGAFGVNAWVAREEGDHVVERHDEVPDLRGATGHQELYVVLRGSASFTVDGRTFAATAGTVVFVEDPSLMREAIAREPGTTVLAVGAPQGEAFAPSPWELRWLARTGAA